MGSKYLILKVGALGDLSFLLPAIDLIHATDPNAEVTWISGKNYAGLLRQNPRIHRVIAVDETALFKGSLFQKAWETLRLWSSLDFHYDQIWIGHRTLGALFLLRLRSLGRLYQIVRKPSGFLRLLRHEIVVPPFIFERKFGFQNPGGGGIAQRNPRSRVACEVELDSRLGFLSPEVLSRFTPRRRIQP